MGEGCEESSSVDLLYYLGVLDDKLKNVDFMICLDSGAMDYESMWVTTSLRGTIKATYNVKTYKNAYHSGKSGVGPSAFSVARGILDKIEDPITGRVAEPLQAEMPESHYKRAE